MINEPSRASRTSMEESSPSLNFYEIILIDKNKDKIYHQQNDVLGKRVQKMSSMC